MKPSASQTKELYDGICTLLRILTVGEKTFAPAGGVIKYNGLDFQTIGFVGRKPDCTATELALFLNVAATTATSTIDRLVKRGLLLRERPESNRRIIALRLSSEGESVFEQMVAHDMQSMTIMLTMLDKSERAPFVSAISKIAGQFGAMEAAEAAKKPA